MCNIQSIYHHCFLQSYILIQDFSEHVVDIFLLIKDLFILFSSSKAKLSYHSLKEVYHRERERNHDYRAHKSNNIQLH
jgi:hypothetical protein